MARTRRIMRWLMLGVAAVPLCNWVLCTADEHGVFVRGDIDDDDLEDFFDDLEDWLDDVFDD